MVARRADNSLSELGVTIESVTPEQAIMARQASPDFGKAVALRA